jgi:hypothetical protein
MHDFKIGQYVYYVRHNRFKAEGRYVVMRLLPRPKGELRYIIRSQDNPEREYTRPMQANCARCRVGVNR